MKKSIIDVRGVGVCGVRGMGVGGFGSCGLAESFGFEFNGINAVRARGVSRFGGIHVGDTVRALSSKLLGGT